MSEIEFWLLPGSIGKGKINERSHYKIEFLLWLPSALNLTQLTVTLGEGTFLE